MLTICNNDKCSGCGLCAFLCPRGAVSLTMNGLHRVPLVRQEICVNCGKCVRLCPGNFPVAPNDVQICGAAWSRDDSIHKECTSGGLATEFYLNFIASGGHVVGCAYNEDRQAEYVVTDRPGDVTRFRGSKYIAPHFPESTYRRIDGLLTKHINVLFIGLPCHCAALKRLYQDHRHLYLIDLLCHGGNSPRLWREYLNVRERKFGKIRNVTFRGGDHDCSICLFGESGRLLYRGGQYTDEYFFSFMKHSALRESCYACPYACERRVGDITLGDFWGLDETFIAEHHLRQGVNVVLVNTAGGQTLFRALSGRIEFYEQPFATAVRGNDTLQMPTPKPADYDFLAEKYRTLGLFRTLRKYDKDYAARLKEARRGRIKAVLKRLGALPGMMFAKAVKP